MLPLHRALLPVVAGVVLLTAPSAGAVSIEALTVPFTGDDITVNVVLTQQGGDIRVDLSVEEGIGDLRGIFFHIADDSLLDGLSAEGDVVTAFAILGVTNVGQGNNLNGGGSPCPCDIGVSLGTPGIGKDDLQAASFVLSHETMDLTLALFSEQWVGVRVTSVGEDSNGKKGGGREGSAKLSGQFTPVPEPATALMLALGLVGIARTGRRRRRVA